MNLNSEKVTKFYVLYDKGNGLLGNFHNLILAIIAIVVLFNPPNLIAKLELIGGIFILSIPIFILLGFISLRIDKVRERLSVDNGSFYTIRNYELNKSSNEALKEILKKLESKKR